MLLGSLNQVGLSTVMSGKKKEGYLEILKPNGMWKKYYFSLNKDMLAYFDLDEKYLPKGLIPLDSITSVYSEVIKELEGIKTQRLDEKKRRKHNKYLLTVATSPYALQ